MSNGDNLFNVTFENLTSLGEEVDIESILLEEEEKTRRSVKLFFCVVYGLLFVLGTIGNGLESS